MARILIVDDAAFMRMMLKDILTKGGFEIAGEAADGNEAVAKYNELKPDLVLLYFCNCVLLYFCNCSVPSQLRKTLNSLVIKNNLCMLHKKSPFVSPCNDIICILICYDRHLFKLMLIIAR